MLFKIFEVLGTPDEQSYANVTRLPFYTSTFPKFPHRGLQFLVPELDKHNTAGMDLLKQLLTLNPLDRPTAADALQHPFFNSIDKSKY